MSELQALSVNQVHELIALYEAKKAEHAAIDKRLFGGPFVGATGIPGLIDVGADFDELDRRDKLIAAYGTPASRAYRGALHALSDEAISLAWLGRGDDDDFAVALAYQRKHFQRRACLAVQAVVPELNEDRRKPSSPNGSKTA